MEIFNSASLASHFMPPSRMRLESYTDLAGSPTKQKEDSERTGESITSKKLEWEKEAVTSRRFHNKSGFLLRVAVSKAGEQSSK